MSAKEFRSIIVIESKQSFQAGCPCTSKDVFTPIKNLFETCTFDSGLKCMFYV